MQKIILIFLVAASAGFQPNPAHSEERKDLGYPGVDDSVRPTTRSAEIAPPPGGPTGSGIIYATEKIGPVPYPPFKGESYERTIPDTLDLAERCALAVHGLTATADPATDYECYNWMGKLREAAQADGTKRGVLALAHSYNDYNGLQPKWIEALPLLRTASGSNENFEIDRRMMEILLHMIDKDGLYRIPVQGAPWDDHKMEKPARQIWNSWPAGRALAALCCWYSRQPDPVLREAIERSVDGLAKKAIHENDSCYFTEKMYDDSLESRKKPDPFTSSMILSTIMTGLAYAYETTDYTPARDLGEKLARFLMRDSEMFKPDGSWASLHFHGTTHMLLGLLEFGMATRNAEIIEFSRRAYEHGRGLGVPVLGWFPELSLTRHACMEPCQTGDMTALAAKLSSSGTGDYWEDVEHYTRNLLQASQITETWWLERMAEQAPQGGPVRPRVETAENVAARMTGTFIGLTAVGGFFQPIAVGCCTGNGARGLYFAWRHILTERDGELKINLLLNRASQWADVDSYLPYLGKVEVTLKRGQRLKIRIPSWAGDGDVKCSVNGAKKTCSMEGRYLNVGALPSGAKVTVQFPLKRETVKTTINVRLLHDGNPDPTGNRDKTYTLDVKGFNVVDIWPRDLRNTADQDVTDWIFRRKNHVKPEDWIAYPFFTDPAYRTDQPRFVQAGRFASHDEMRW